MPETPPPSCAQSGTGANIRRAVARGLNSAWPMFSPSGAAGLTRPGPSPASPKSRVRPSEPHRPSCPISRIPIPSGVAARAAHRRSGASGRNEEQLPRGRQFMAGLAGPVVDSSSMIFPIEPLTPAAAGEMLAQVVGQFDQPGPASAGYARGLIRKYFGTGIAGAPGSRTSHRTRRGRAAANHPARHGMQRGSGAHSADCTAARRDRGPAAAIPYRSAGWQ